MAFTHEKYNKREYNKIGYIGVPIIIKNNKKISDHPKPCTCHDFSNRQYSKTTTLTDIILHYNSNPTLSQHIGKKYYDYQLIIKVTSLQKTYEITGSLDKKNLDQMESKLGINPYTRTSYLHREHYLELHFDYDITDRIKLDDVSTLIRSSNLYFQVYKKSTDSRYPLTNHQIHSVKEILTDSEPRKAYLPDRPILIENTINDLGKENKIIASLKNNKLSIYITNITEKITNLFHVSNMKNDYRVTFILQALHQPKAVINYRESNQIIDIEHQFVKLTISGSDITINHRKPMNKTETIDLSFKHLSQESSVEKSEEELLAQQWQSIEKTDENLKTQLDDNILMLKNTSLENHDFTPSSETIKDQEELSLDQAIKDLKSLKVKDNPEIRVEFNLGKSNANPTVDKINNLFSSKNIMETAL